MKTKWFSLFLLLALVFLPLKRAYAQSPDNGDVVRVGEDFTLESDEVVTGNLVVIGGNLTIETGASVKGDVVVVGGSAQVEEDTAIGGSLVVVGGSLNTSAASSGDVVIVGGNATIADSVAGSVVTIGGQTLLTETAVISEDVVTFGGKITEEEGAQVSGDIVTNIPSGDVPDMPSIPNVPSIPGAPNLPETARDYYSNNPLWELGGVFLRALAIAAIAMLLALFLQPQMARASDTLAKQPFIAGSFGLMALVIALLGVVIMSVTIILIPVAAIVFMGLPLVWLFGIIAIGYEVGERITAALRQTWPPPLSAGFGAFLFTLVLGLVNMVDCIGFLLVFLVSLLAFGSVLMTWFGARVTPIQPTEEPGMANLPPAS